MSATVTPTAGTTTYLGDNPAAERVYDNVQATVPGVQLTMIKLALWNAIDEFALRSTYFRKLVSWEMASGVQSIDFNPFDAEMAVCWILSQCGLYHFTVEPPAVLIDYDQATQDRRGTATLALKPIRFDTNLPAVLFSHWFETMLDGTLFRLYGQPAKPYTSPQLASYHGGRFRQGINRARDIAERGNTGEAQAWRFPSFAHGRRKQ